MKASKILGGAAAVALIGAGSIWVGTSPASSHEPWARTVLRDASGERVGTVTFSAHGRHRTTEVTVNLRRGSGVTGSTFHGLHIHANDNPANGTGCVADPAAAPSTWFVSADGHWKHDPTELHGGHAGDLPSVFVNADGSSEARFHVDKLDPAAVAGRAVVLHAGADNFGNVPVGPAEDQYLAGPAAVAKTQGTGNAGDRFACGVIGG